MKYSFGAALAILIAVPTLAASVTKLSTPKELATDSAHCKISYDGSKAERSLTRKCVNSKSETKYFSLEDTSAPLLQNEIYKIGNRAYLATRWATGHGEEVVIFDLSKEPGEPAYRVVSDGPSTVSFDAKAKRVKIVALTAPPAESASQPVSKTILWPATNQ